MLFELFEQKPHFLVTRLTSIQLLAGMCGRCKTTENTSVGLHLPWCWGQWCLTSRASTTAGEPTWSSPMCPSQTGLSSGSRLGAHSYCLRTQKRESVIVPWIVHVGIYRRQSKLISRVWGEFLIWVETAVHVECTFDKLINVCSNSWLSLYLCSSLSTFFHILIVVWVISTAIWRMKGPLKAPWTPLITLTGDCWRRPHGETGRLGSARDMGRELLGIHKRKPRFLCVPVCSQEHEEQRWL